ncbi:MAG: threonyl-tRNA synthetase editing domain-containing protein [Candidatus Bathyarchaeota archaeon]|nr:MAG: threonyl-tRNA synthetase editing domain-containing protein [Candidatus Bathyarchaeota archaeon]
MRVLQLHCSDFRYQVRRETPVAEQPASPREESLEDVLVCFICFEKRDEQRIDEIIDLFVENVKVDVSRIGCSMVLLYPYAHLSKSLGSARLAKGFLSGLRDRLEEGGLETHKSPFGWYKAFDLSCIGHPLSEAYREY